MWVVLSLTSCYGEGDRILIVHYDDGMTNFRETK